MWLETGSEETWVRRLIDMAGIQMMTFVATSATACERGGIRIRNGGEGMNCSQNSTPTRKKLACISQMCTAWLFSARSNSTGTCQASITALHATTPTQARSSQPAAARHGPDHPP